MGMGKITLLATNVEWFSEAQKICKASNVYKVKFNNPEIYLKQVSITEVTVDVSDELGSSAFQLLEKTSDGKFQCQKCKTYAKLCFTQKNT